MQVQDRGVLAERHLIKKRNFQTKPFLDELTMPQSHRDNEVIPLDQFLGQEARDMRGRVNSLSDQSVRNDWVDGFRLGLDARRFNPVGRLSPEMGS